MPSLDLPNKYKSEIISLLKKYAPGYEVWAYGSRVKGNSHDSSDLDLVLRHPKDRTQRIENLEEVRAAFRDSNIPIIVDVSDWARIPDDFKAEIEKLHVEML